MKITKKIPKLPPKPIPPPSNWQIIGRIIRNGWGN